MYARTRLRRMARGDGGKRDGESARATRLQHVHRERMLRRCTRRCPERIARGCARVCVYVYTPRVQYVRETLHTIYGTRRVHAHACTIRRARTWRTWPTTIALLGNVRVPRRLRRRGARVAFHPHRVTFIVAYTYARCARRRVRYAVHGGREEK